MNKEPNIYKPEFIPYYPAIADKYGLNPIETLVYGFIRFYTSSTNNAFYFSNEQIGQIVGRHAVNISKAIARLLEVGALEAEYEVKASGGTVRFLKARLSEITKSDLTKSLSQTKRNRLPNNNKVNKNKVKNINTVPASPVVIKKLSTSGDKSVDKRGNGIKSLGDLLRGRSVPVPDTKSRIYTPWQDHALRVGEKLGVKVDSAWFKLFKDLTVAGKASKLDSAYSQTVDSGARDPKKYFFWAVAH